MPNGTPAGSCRDVSGSVLPLLGCDRGIEGVGAAGAAGQRGDTEGQGGGCCSSWRCSSFARGELCALAAATAKSGSKHREEIKGLLQCYSRKELSEQQIS